MRKVSLALIVFLCLFSASCAVRFNRVERGDVLAGYLAQIDRYNRRVYQLKASLDIKAFGLLGNLARQQADMVITKPQFLYWSFRSFHGLPIFVLASDGQFVTALDFSDDSARYHRSPVRGDSLVEYFNFVIHPRSLVDIFLAQVPLEAATDIEIGRHKDRIKILATLKDGWRLTSIFDVKQNRLVKTKLDLAAKNLSYEAVYHKYDEASGIYFPKQLVVFVQDKNRSASLRIKLTNIELNGAQVPPDIFYLRPNH